jgi:hypothetical protein
MTLTEMLDELRAEARISQNTAHGQQATDSLSKMLRRVQEELYLSFDWPHLHTSQTKNIPAFDHTAEYPSLFSFGGIVSAFVRSATNTRWSPLTYGIGPDEYSTSDPTATTAGAAQRWQNYLSPDAETINSNMFEIWPAADFDQTVLFTGKRSLFPLTAPNHVSSIDGPLIILHAAAEILAGQKAEDASLKLQKAQDRARLLRIRLSVPDNRPTLMSGGGVMRAARPGLDYIPRG